MSAKTLYENFRGSVSRRLVETGIRYASRWLTRRCKLNILIPPDLAIIGHLNAFEYDCVRDGKLVKARHDFTPECRPFVAVGEGRGEVFLLGTSYRFTDRGFIDYNTQGEAVEYVKKTGQIKKLRE